MLPGRVGPGAGAGLRYNLRQAKEQGQKLQALEASTKAEALSLLLEMREKLAARLESERAERAGEEHERTDWRAVAQDDLVDSDGEPCFEDPRKAEWTSLPQDPREAPEDKLAAATTSGAGVAKSQFKVFDSGGGV